MRLPADAIAYHEAGHAVAAILLGVPLDHVEIDPLSTDQRGRAQPLDTEVSLRTREGRALFERLAQVGLAGPLVEIQWMHQHGAAAADIARVHAENVDGEADDDIPQVESHLRTLCVIETHLARHDADAPEETFPTVRGMVEQFGPPPEAHFNALWQYTHRQTVALLVAHWGAVDAVAAALLREHRLRGEKVARLVAQAAEQTSR
jgi:hypothetical protein